MLLSGRSFLFFIFTLCVTAIKLVKHDASFVPDIVLRISESTILQNCQPRLSTLVNGTYPGPPLYLKPDVTTWIRVYNDADVNSTIHWHGLTQSTSPFSDGTPLVSQWPIPPGHFFDYELHPTASEAGTYFYHSHVGFQAITASGPLIVLDAGSPPYQYDDDLILQTGDYFPEDDNTIENMLNAVPQQWPGEPSALLINGQSGTAPTMRNPTPDKSCQPYLINVQPGKTYRMRFIGATALSMLALAFDKHTSFDIIEADGYYTERYTVDHIQIDSGQRFSVLFPAKTQAELQALGTTQFWVQMETREAGGPITTAYAILNYQTTITKKDVEVGDPNWTNPSIQWQTATTFTSKPTQPSFSQQIQSSVTWPQSQTKSYPPTQPSSKLPVSSSVPSKYNGIPYIPTNPLLSIPYSENWLEYALVNLPQPGYLQPIAASEVTRRIVISWTQLADNNQSGRTIEIGSVPGQNQAAGQGYSWFDTAPNGPSHPSPYLVDIYKYGQAAIPDYQRALANGGVDPILDAWPATVGEVLEIVWQNAASDSGLYGVHPMHAHGGPYFDIGSGPGKYDADANNAKLAQLDWQGSLRDTTVIYAPATTGPPYVDDGWRAWRMRVTESNIGVWMMHCHILQHMIMGQQTVWVLGNADQIVQGSNGEQNQLQGYFTYGGNVVGSEGGSSKRGLQRKWPTVAHFFD